jgi:putative tryptophan/tyrosine transport system substrate-binding protein
MRRREFIAGLGSAAAWPMVARAQQGDRVRRIGVLMPYEEYDPEAKAQLSAFTQGLAELGWIGGNTLRIDIRWATGDPDRMRMFAKELVGLHPDVIFVSGTPSTAALQRETRTIPIVFTNVADPVGEGFVAGLSRPAGNLTGFIYTEAGIAGKWVELLIEMAPAIKRAAIMFNPDTAPGGGSYFLPAFEAAARSLKVEPIAAPVHSDAEIETFINSFGREPGGGLAVTGDAFMFVHRAPIILATARNNMLAVYQSQVFVSAGGLLSYGPDEVGNFHRTASYVDRILHGATPADLPVQLPVKFQMTINLKTAKALGLTVPPSILHLADEVIQ